MQFLQIIFPWIIKDAKLPLGPIYHNDNWKLEYIDIGYNRIHQIFSGEKNLPIILQTNKKYYKDINYIIYWRLKYYVKYD